MDVLAMNTEENTQKNTFKFILASYTPEEYKKIQALSEDGNDMDPTWAEWRKTVHQAKLDLAMKGMKCIEKPIDAEGLLTYCLENGIRVDQAARASYAQWLHEKNPNDVSQEALSESEEEECSTTRTHSYTPPADQLLTYTSLKGKGPLPEISYVEKFGLGPEHIPELIRMATDEDLASEDATDLEYYATIHAVYVLAELHAESAIEPLLALFDTSSAIDNEWMLETLVDFFTIIGPVALPSLEQFLADPSYNESAQSYVAETIGKIAKKHPQARMECIAVVTRRLEAFEVNHPELNASLIGDLLKMNVVEAAPLIERAYASGRVDEFFYGDWNEAQYELGLKERPPIKERFPILPAPSAPLRSPLSTAKVLAPQPSKKSPPSKKAKTKMIKASKKANRRKK